MFHMLFGHRQAHVGDTAVVCGKGVVNTTDVDLNGSSPERLWGSRCTRASVGKQDVIAVNRKSSF